MSGKKNTTVKNPAWMLRKPAGSGVGFNKTMNKKVSPKKPSPKKSTPKRRTTRRARNPRIMYE